MTSEEMKLFQRRQKYSWYIKEEQSWRVRTNKGIKDILQRKDM